MYSISLSRFMCQWMPVPTPSAALPPPTNSVNVVDRLGVLSRPRRIHETRRTLSPWNFSGQWQFSHVTRAPAASRAPATARAVGTFRVGDLPELTRARHLRLDQRADAGADVARDARHARVRAALMRDVLRLHRRMADPSAELRRLHVVHRAERGHREKHEIDQVSATTIAMMLRWRGMRRSRTGQSAGGASGDSRRRRAASRAPSGMSSRPSTNAAGMATNSSRPRYGLWKYPKKSSSRRTRNTTAVTVVMAAPRSATG